MGVGFPDIPVTHFLNRRCCRQCCRSVGCKRVFSYLLQSQPFSSEDAVQKWWGGGGVGREGITAPLSLLCKPLASDKFQEVEGLV